MLGLLFASAVRAADQEPPAAPLDTQPPDTHWPQPMATASFGFGFPFVVSASAGVLLPLGRQEPKDIFPTVPALRFDGEIGLGGGSVAAGIYLPVGSSFALNLKAVRLRTWLVPWQQDVNRFFNGAVIEFVLLGHVPGKLGLGHFEAIDPLIGGRNAFSYAFFGVGF